MIFALYGKVDQVLESSVIINVNNVYYEVFTSNVSEFSLGNFYKVFIKVFIREDGFLNVGFLTEIEMDLFNNLMSISGIGIKIALNIIKSSDYQSIIGAIVTKNSEFLASLNGVNETLASLICAKLSKKFSKYDYLSEYEGKVTFNANLYKILANLGYKNSEINKIKDKIPPYVNLNEGLKIALKELSNGRNL